MDLVEKRSERLFIQCIGRGTRPDRRGPNGTNLEKELLLRLPTSLEALIDILQTYMTPEYLFDMYC